MHYPATLRVGPLTNIPFILRFLGYEPEPILAASGFESAQFEDTENKVSFLAASKLLAHCVKVSGCDHFGFLLGEHANPSHLGIAGFLLSSAPNVNSALNRLINYLDLHDQGGLAALTITEDTALFGYIINQPNVEAAGQIYDLSMVMACKVMRSLCGEKWDPNEVLLTHKEPDNSLHLQKFFQAPIRFNSQENALVFDKKWLNHNIPSADPFLQSLLLREADKQHTVEQPTDLLRPLQQLLVHSLANKKITAVDIAKQLEIHERTLHRRLKLLGTSFRSELEQSRYAISQQLLTETNESLVDISLALGYSSVSAFSRAFKQWSGKAPAKWRKEFHMF
mgnify:FL=1